MTQEIKKTVCIILCLVSVLSHSFGEARLWYKQPANSKFKFDDENRWKNSPEWLSALPVGNGSLGGMIYGDVTQERIQLNEESMWSGSPNDDLNPLAFKNQSKIRQLLFNGKFKEALDLTQKTQVCTGSGSGSGKGADVPFGSYQTLGDLWIDFDNKSNYSNYERELDLETAMVNIRYKQDDVSYKREIFVSHPDQVMVMKFSSDKKGKISFRAKLSRPERFNIVTQKDQLIMRGTLSNGKGGDGMQYMARLGATNQGGELSYSSNELIVKNADEVILFLTASTDHILAPPRYKGREYEDITENKLHLAKKTSYEKLVARHQEEYKGYYDRVSLTLKETKQDDTPTDVRLERFKKNPTDQHLISLLFQYGRYLLISSSRPSTLPANLQGIWAEKIQNPWNGDYHTDINVQMNYWLAESTNLGEMHLPLFDLMKSLVPSGKKTAKAHYNAKGWVLHPITNVWGFTAPGENANWGMHVGGGAWLATHIMEHYYFTLDKKFLEDNFSILEESVLFYLDWLIPDPNTGELISGPSVSPENLFIAPDGTKTKVCMGPTHDHEVIWQLFKNYIDASQALGMNTALQAKVVEAQEKLAKPKIGKDGRLMEWAEEYKEDNPGHRHISHLYGLHPGYQIDPSETPKIAKAARKSLDHRIAHGGGHTGWSAAWLVNQYARLGDGDKAQKSIHSLLIKRTSPNLFGQHPPFQIDANFGVAAGIAEMLLQSHTKEIRLLPALPTNWTEGEVKGLCARGGFIIDMKWDKHQLTAINLYSKHGGKAILTYQGKQYSFDTKAGKSYQPLAKLR